MRDVNFQQQPRRNTIKCYNSRPDPQDPSGENRIAMAIVEPAATIDKVYVEGLRLDYLRDIEDGSGDQYDGGMPYFDGGIETWGDPTQDPLGLEGLEAQRQLNQQDPDPIPEPYPRAFIVFRKNQVADLPLTSFAVACMVTLDVPESVIGDQLNEVITPICELADDEGTVQTGEVTQDALRFSERFDTFMFIGSLSFGDEDPVMPGLYRLRFGLRFENETGWEDIADDRRKAVANILLPQAGPEIADWLIREARAIIESDGMADHWNDHIEQQAPQAWSAASVDLTRWGLGSFTLGLPLYTSHAFLNTSPSFDYSGFARIEGVCEPTRRFNYNQELGPHNHATLQGHVVKRTIINEALWAVWGKAAMQWDDATLEIGAELRNLFEHQRLEYPSATEAYLLGFDLFRAIQEGRSDEWIKANTLNPVRAQWLQTERDPVQEDEDVHHKFHNDLRLWPRPDFSAAANTNPWHSNTDPHVGDGFERPAIFLTHEQMFPPGQ